MTLNKNSRTWYINRCNIPGDSDCVSYQLSLVQDINGKWYLETPNFHGTTIRIRAKVDEDHMSLRSFKAGNFSHNTIDGGSIWKLRESTAYNSVIETTTILHTVEKKVYDDYLKGKVFTPLKETSKLSIFFAGKQTEINGKSKVETSLHGRISHNKDSRNWYIVRCILPGESDCIIYVQTLVRDLDGRWFWETMKLDGSTRRSEAKVDGDNFELLSFTTQWNDENGKPCCTFSHNNLNAFTIWNLHEGISSGNTIYTKTILQPIKKKAYEDFIKGKVVTPLSIILQRQKK